ncbi:MAG TPA: N-acetylgalactosamine 6-sulfate sulfatase, partial [Verrucomicrobia bacterium]|nr:N-acetylgalactosamine 6-sulfate sulfatase [Verrucomicrobiota bacterium]
MFSPLYLKKAGVLFRLSSWACVCFLCYGLCFASTQSEKPNILMILVDDLGYGDLSSYGAKDLKSPNIDRLMTDGIRFNNFYANCPVCSPTRAALLTGRYPDRVGVPGVIRTHPEDSWGFLSRRAVLIPEVLKQVGYVSALIGKWHLGLTSPNTPMDRGFEEFHGFLGDMMDDYFHHRRFGNNYMRRNRNVIDPQGHA